MAKELTYFEVKGSDPFRHVGGPVWFDEYPELFRLGDLSVGMPEDIGAFEARSPEEQAKFDAAWAAWQEHGTETKDAKVHYPKGVGLVRLLLRTFKHAYCLVAGRKSYYMQHPGGCSLEMIGMKPPTGELSEFIDARAFDRAVLQVMAAKGIPSAITVNRVPLVEFIRGWVEGSRRVAYAGSVAGWKAGVYPPGVIANGAVAVTDSPRVITPAPGDTPFLDSLLTKVFKGHQQYQRFLKWLGRCHLRVSQSKPEMHVPALILAGLTCSFKTFIQELIVTPAVGGRRADPYQYLKGDTSFNEDLVGSEHQCMADKSGVANVRTQQLYSDTLKAIASEIVHRAHGKGKPAAQLKLAWCVSLSINIEDPEALQACPDLFRSDTRDKILALVCSRVDPKELTIPIGDGSEASKDAAVEAVKQELPALLHKAITMEYPEEILCPRFGVKGWVHPLLAEEAAGSTNGAALLAWLDEYFFPRRPGGPCPYEGSAAQLQAELLKAREPDCQQARMTLNAFGSLLSRLAHSHPGRVKCLGRMRRDGAPRTVWQITPGATRDDGKLPLANGQVVTVSFKAERLAEPKSAPANKRMGLIDAALGVDYET